MGAFLRGRKNRAFRFNSSELLRNSSGISASIPCAAKKWHPCHFLALGFYFAKT
jgi:hypothetical protein